MTPTVRRALRAVKAALARQEARAARRLIGRWALPSGQSFKVIRFHEHRALCGNGRARWWVDIATLVTLADEGQLRFLGR